MDKRPFNDELAEKVIDAQVKEIDRLHATNKDILRVNLEHANNIVQLRERIAELETQVAHFQTEYQDEIGRSELIANITTLKAEIARLSSVLQNKEEPTK